MIEAAGWRTSAPKGRAARRARAPRKSFGVEARQPYRGDGLHFYVGPSNGSRRFYWIFPAGDHVRAGLATYTGHSALSQDLVDFLDRHDLGDPGHQHGGFFTSRLIDPIRDGMFVVGDAAGQCLPVSGEGIRPALVFGQLAGRLAERVRLGELPLDQALSRYRAYVLSRGARLPLPRPPPDDPQRPARPAVRRVRPHASPATACCPGRSRATGGWPTPTCSRRSRRPSRSRWSPPPSDGRAPGPGLYSRPCSAPS